ncbi:hypothetical protein Purlil1_12112 [Purpureocillium lilacinum]|uniref:Chromo domain-containing protein n=1 Tax=Purpureocillium lilacinum TaxID=33203 RepID=A0ABR0BHS2_PURLI|nr:hypothetical protein Purlil1_12112 [Purpureocillium lilacinum]
MGRSRRKKAHPRGPESQPSMGSPRPSDDEKPAQGGPPRWWFSPGPSVSSRFTNHPAVNPKSEAEPPTPLLQLPPAPPASTMPQQPRLGFPPEPPRTAASRPRAPEAWMTTDCGRHDDTARYVAGESAVPAHPTPGNGDQFLVDPARSAAPVVSYPAPRSSGWDHATSSFRPAIHHGQPAQFVTGPGPELSGQGWPHGAFLPEPHGTGHGTVVSSSRHIPAAPNTAGVPLVGHGAPPGGWLPGWRPAEPETQHRSTAVRAGALSKKKSKKARRRLRDSARANTTSGPLAGQRVPAGGGSLPGRQPAEPATHHPSMAGKATGLSRNARKRLLRRSTGTNSTTVQLAVQGAPLGGGPLPGRQPAEPATHHPSMAGKATGLSRNARKRLLRRSTGTNSTTVQLAVQGAPLGGGPLPCRHLAEPATPYPSTAGRAGKKKKARRRLRELARANTTSVQPAAAPPGVGPLRGWQLAEPETQHPSTAVQAEPQARRPCEQQRANQCANTEIPPADAPAPPADGPARDGDGEASGTRAAKRGHPGSRPVTRAISAATAAAAAAAAGGPVATATPPTPTQSHAAASTAAPAAPAGAIPTPGPQPGDRNQEAPSPRKRKRGCSNASSAPEPQPDSGDATHDLARAPEPQPGFENDVYVVYRVLGRHGYKYLVQWQVDGSVGLVTRSAVLDRRMLKKFDSRKSHKGLDEGVDVLRKRARKTGEYQYQIQWPGSEQSVDGCAERRWVAARCIAEERREQELPSIAPKFEVSTVETPWLSESMPSTLWGDPAPFRTGIHLEGTGRDAKGLEFDEEQQVVSQFSRRVRRVRRLHAVLHPARERRFVSRFTSRTLLPRFLLCVLRDLHPLTPSRADRAVRGNLAALDAAAHSIPPLRGTGRHEPALPPPSVSNVAQFRSAHGRPPGRHAARRRASGGQSEPPAPGAALPLSRPDSAATASRVPFERASRQGSLAPEGTLSIRTVGDDALDTM